MSTQPLQLGRRPQKAAERERLVRRAKQLAWLGVVWHGVEAVIAMSAGLIAGSIALIGFGADSLIESPSRGSSSCGASRLLGPPRRTLSGRRRSSSRSAST